MINEEEGEEDHGSLVYNRTTKKQQYNLYLYDWLSITQRELAVQCVKVGL